LSFEPLKFSTQGVGALWSSQNNTWHDLWKMFRAFSDFKHVLEKKATRKKTFFQILESVKLLSSSAVQNLFSTLKIFSSIFRFWTCFEKTWVSSPSSSQTSSRSPLGIAEQNLTWLLKNVSSIFRFQTRFGKKRQPEKTFSKIFESVKTLEFVERAKLFPNFENFFIHFSILSVFWKKSCSKH
jgi:hypothetical protein